MWPTCECKIGWYMPHIRLALHSRQEAWFYAHPACRILGAVFSNSEVRNGPRAIADKTAHTSPFRSNRWIHILYWVAPVFWDIWRTKKCWWKLLICVLFTESGMISNRWWSEWHTNIPCKHGKHSEEELAMVSRKTSAFPWAMVILYVYTNRTVCCMWCDRPRH